MIEGQAVRYHPIIGGPHDGKVYVVRMFGELHGRRVAWLWKKPGCVAVEVLSAVTGDDARPEPQQRGQP